MHYSYPQVINRVMNNSSITEAVLTDNIPTPIPRETLLAFVRRKAMVGMSSDQIAAEYAEYYHVTYDHAKKVMQEPDYKQAAEAGRQSGFAKLWEVLYGQAVDKKDNSLLILLAKEQLKLFAEVDSNSALFKSSLPKNALRTIHELVFPK